MTKSRIASTAIVLMLWLATAIVSPAQIFKTVANFDGTNGANPYYESLVQGTDGNFYGTTYSGGTSAWGTVFRITPGGTLIALHSFDWTDGADPFAGLIQAGDGNFYGTTYTGGADSFGTVFKITLAGSLTTLYSFDGSNGLGVAGGLVQANDRNFYGTTNTGGGDGTIFKITPRGDMTVLSNFDGSDGAFPYAGLFQSADRNLYGTTFGGGNGNQLCMVGCGTVFKVTLAGNLTRVYAFCSQPNCRDGAGPLAGLIQAADGNFYGVTSGGGANTQSCPGGCGTVFKISSKGALTTLYSFCALANCTDGAKPSGALVQGTDGDLYGTTDFGGNSNCTYQYGCGTVFKITAAGKLATLYTFCSETGCADGFYPDGGLIQATNGRFYGTTYSGGTGAGGTVFSMSVGLGPFVEARPTFGEVGTRVIILGNKLNGTSSVAFNGTSAQFKVVSNTEIATSVPKRATTGYVMVTTSGKKLRSNVKFRVTQ